MTVIIAAESPTGVVLGCDSYLGSHGTRLAISRAKWFVNGPCILAFAGSVRGAQVAEHWLKPFRAPKRNEPDESYLVTVVAASIRGAHEHVGGEAEKLVEHNGAVFLVAFRGRVHLIQGDYSVARTRDGYAALGAGEDFALGALAATHGMPPRDRVRLALEAATRHCSHVSAPFHYTEQRAPSARSSTNAKVAARTH